MSHENMNPTTRGCFVTCASCYRCADKGTKPQCNNCSGRNDPLLVRDPDPDDRCDCRNGVLRWKTREGKLIVAKIPGNPFAGQVVKEKETKSESDYNMYLNDMREKTGDEHWSPVRFEHGESTDEWYKRHKQGLA